MSLPPLTSRSIPGDTLALNRLFRVDASGVAAGPPVVLRGFNVSGHTKVRGFPCGNDPTSMASVADQVFNRLESDGFNLVRLPLIWEWLEPTEGAWDAVLAAALRDFVSRAGRHGIYVLIDIHQDLVSSIFHGAHATEYHGTGLPPWLVQKLVRDVGGVWTNWPWAANYEINEGVRRAIRALGSTDAQGAFRAFAQRLGQTFAGLSNVLGYEPLNEPFWPLLADTDEVHAWSDLCQQVREGLQAAGALAADPTLTPTVLASPCGNWVTHNGLPPSLETDANKITLQSGFTAMGPGPAAGSSWSGAPRFWLSAPHIYDPHVYVPILPPSSSSYAKVVDACVDVLGNVDGFQLAPLIGEFGVPSTVCGGASVRDQLHRAWLDAFEARGLSWCHWNFNPECVDAGGDDYWCGEKFSVAYRDGSGVKTSPAYLALLRPFVLEMAAPIRGTRFDLARDGSWRWELDQGQTFDASWSTRVFVPASLGAFQCPGATVDGRSVRAAPAADAPLVVTGRLP